MPLPRLHIEDPDRGLPRQPVPVRYSYFITGLTPWEFLRLFATRQEGLYEYLTAYEFVHDAEPRQIRPAVYKAIADKRRGDEPAYEALSDWELRPSIDEALIERLPTSHFVWSDELAGAFSKFIRDYLDDETANREGMGLVWHPALNGTEAFLSECVDLSSLTESVPTPGPPEYEYLFRRSPAGGWEITFEGRSCGPFKDSHGLHYLKQLLQNPGRTVSAITLSNFVHQPTRSERDAARMDIAETLVATESDDENQGNGPDELSTTFGGYASEATDEESIKQYKSRYRKLNDQLEDAKERGEVERAAEIENEKEALVRHIRATTRRTGDRRRPLAPRLDKSTAKRAYDAVYKNIQRAIDHLKKFCPGLGQHLHDHVTYVHGEGWRYKPPTKMPWHF